MSNNQNAVSITRKKNLKKFNCVDLFAGAGGFSLAAINSGYKVKFAIENDKHACSTYKYNFCDGNIGPKLYEADITELDPQSVYEEVFLPDEICDVLLGGPPCQGFSTHRIKGAGIKDPRNSLIHVYFDFVKAIQPNIFLMENVPGMLWPRHASYLEKFYEVGHNAGYYLFKPVVIDARDFGLPQRRKRVFVLGVKNGVNTENLTWPPKPTHCEKKLTANCGLLPWVDCSSIFKPPPKGDPNNIHMNHTRELIDVFKSTPPNGGSRKDSGRVLACHADHDGHKDVYGRIDPKEPGPTMTTACINPSKGRFVHPTKHHGITVREAARMQTFPDDFVFKGGLIASGQQIGNAVPIELGKFLLSYLKPLVENARQTDNKKYRKSA